MTILKFKDGTKMEATVLFSAISVLIVLSKRLFYIVNKESLIDDNEERREWVSSESSPE